MTDHIGDANEKVVDLDKLEALAKAASEGPWTLTAGQTSYPECDDADSWSAVLTPRGNEVITLYERYGKRGDDRSDYDDDAAYIAAANPATILDLIASARRDAEEIERLRAALQWYANPEIYKPHPHGPAFDRRDLSYHAAATLRPQPFARAAHTGEG